MRALNLKLNADRLDAKPSDYFDAVIYLNNANWDKQKVAQFLDKSVSWIEDIVRYVPGMDPRLRKMLDEGKISWNKARNICRTALDAEPGKEKDVVEKALAELTGSPNPSKAVRRPLTVKKVARRLFKQVENNPRRATRLARKTCCRCSSSCRATATRNRTSTACEKLSPPSWIE